MTLQLIFTLAFLLFMGYLLFRYRPPQSPVNVKGFLILLFSASFVLRLILGYFTIGFSGDIALFKAWGQLCNDVGYNAVYSQEVFLDYPPGYLYVLSWLDGLRGLFGFPVDSQAHTLLIKLPSILSDMVTGYVIYRYAARKMCREKGLLLSAAYLLCPVVLLNSAVWGQIDSICTLILLSSIYLLYKNRLIPSAIIYGLAVATKPQMLIFAPIYLFYTLWRKKFAGLFVGVGCAILAIMIIATPFVKNFDYLWLIQKYQSTMDFYSYYTVNAYNLWGILGQNWAELPTNPVALFALNWAAPAIATAICGLYLFKVREKHALFLAPAILMSTVFILAVKMHERYLFPTLLFLLITYIKTKDRRYLMLFGGFATVHYLNCAYVLFLANSYISPWSIQILLLSAAHIGLYVWLLYVAFFGHKKPRTEEHRPPVKPKNKLATPNNTPPEPAVDRALHKQDYILAAAVTLIYAGFAFWNLGVNVTANTSWEPNEGESVILEAQEDYSSLTYLYGISSTEGDYYRVGANFDVSMSDDQVNWESVGSLKEENLNVYGWRELSIENGKKYLRITAADSGSVLNEVALKSTDGSRYIAVSSANGGVLLDEQSVVPLHPSYYNSTYFDEIYHARTAYEHVLGVEAYENTHPPLGKLIIAQCIRIFGMNPFGWRFAGALFGVLMLPVLYHILKRLFGSSFLSLAGTLLFAFDFMHFTQTRIATIDTYAVFFILLMYDAMLVFIQKDIVKSKLRELLLPLALSGIFMGLGVASKWTCAYGAVGLAVLLFGKFWQVYRDAENKKACMQRIIDLCLCCIPLFLVIPFGIYFAAFLPLTTLPHNSGDVFGNFVSYQTNMYNYHAHLDAAPHFFASPWYEWPLDLRDIWYSINHNVDGNGSISTISCLGNPLLWWSGLVSLVTTVYLFIKKRTTIAAFILTGFAAVYLPWVLISRMTFVYHYFTAVPFIIIALILCITKLMSLPFMARPLGPRGLLEKVSTGTALITAFVVLNLILFAVFYPVISGAPTTAAYADALEWLPNWTFA